MKFKKTSNSLTINSLIVILIIITIVFVSKKFSDDKTNVLFIGLSDSIEYKVDQNTKLFLAKSKYYDLKRSLNNLSPGTHILHYDTSPVTRYCAMIEVEKGRNIIQPVFEYHSLPSLSIYRSYSNKSANRINNRKSFNYITFSEKGTAHNNLVEIDINQEIKKKSDNYFYIFSWDLILNNKSVSRNHVTRPETANSGETICKQIIFQDSTHRYTAEYFFKKGAAKLKIGSDYL